MSTTGAFSVFLESVNADQRAAAPAAKRAAAPRRARSASAPRKTVPAKPAPRKSAA